MLFYTKGVFYIIINLYNIYLTKVKEKTVDIH